MIVKKFEINIFEINVGALICFDYVDVCKSWCFSEPIYFDDIIKWYVYVPQSIVWHGYLSLGKPQFQLRLVLLTGCNQQ